MESTQSLADKLTPRCPFKTSDKAKNTHRSAGSQSEGTLYRELVLCGTVRIFRYRFIAEIFPRKLKRRGMEGQRFFFMKI